MMELNNYEEGFTLAEVLDQTPELKDFPQLNEYGFSAESMFEMMAKQLEEKTGLRATRNNRDDKYAVDFNISKKNKPNEIICYVELEADLSGAFKEEDGAFIHNDLTIPIEKKKYFLREKPCFYIKFSRDFKWCYVVDTKACKHLFVEVNRSRKMWNGETYLRKFWSAKSCSIFKKHDKYGIHRLHIQDWLKAIAFFMKMRYSQLKLSKFENEKEN